MKTIGTLPEASVKIPLRRLIAKHPSFVAKAAERHIVLTHAVFRCRDFVYRIDFGMTVLQSHRAKQVFILQGVQAERISFQCKQVDHRDRV
ncbi:hypothetical protein D3C81_1392170 [compost metagenome]